MILIAGGAGYIGSHTAVELLEKGYEVVIADNFENSYPTALEGIKKITNKDFKFYEIDLNNKEEVNKIFEENKIDAVIDFAALKSVKDSVEKPLQYYRQNLGILLNLLEVMNEHNVKKMIFSSSACVYGISEGNPIKESARLNVTNPYGSTKIMSEQILRDLAKSDSEWSIVILRYFNPIGAHKSGIIGENPKGMPNNLMPIILKVAKGDLEALTIFGYDYDTEDGTCIRDYIHVVDLALGHIKALDRLKYKGVSTYNLGTGNGYSVLDLINTFQTANNIRIDYKLGARRPGDVAANYADPSKAKKELDWVAERDLDDMCEDAWNWANKKNEQK